ncbi:MAG: outer membrane protein [Porticoccaceae bacterium]|jgi:outer membrane protein
MNVSFKLLSLGLALSFIAASAFASDAVGPGEKDSRWVVGGAIETGNNIYAGESDISSLTPHFRYNGERFFVKNGTFNVNVGKNGNFSYGLTVSPSGSFLSDDHEYRKNEKLAGLRERDYTVEGGFYVNHTTEAGRMSFSLTTDLGNEHDGETAHISYTFDLRAGDWYVNPVIGAQWVSSGKVDHFFGVSESESNESRQSYDGESTFNVFAGIRARYALTEKWDVNLAGGVVALGSGIKDSSIVDDDTANYASVGVSYSF